MDLLGFEPARACSVLEPKVVAVCGRTTGLLLPEMTGETGLRRGRAIAAILHKDAFLAFRALCKLSIRTSESAGASDLAALRGKVRPWNGQAGRCA